MVCRVLLKMKFWMGIGVSNTYVEILKKFPEKIKNKNYSRIILIIANEPNFNYNNHPKKQLAEDLFNLAEKIKNKIKNSKIEVKNWDFLSSNKRYQELFSKYKRMFKKNKKFHKDVLDIVEKNRKFYSKEKERKANYVLEELSSIMFFAEKGFVKTGPNEKEKDFDNLAIKYPLNDKIAFERF